MSNQTHNHPTQGPPLRRILLAATAALVLAAPAWAAIEENYAPGEPPITTTWFVRRSDAAQQADRDYVAGMRPHHAGALSMSRDYLVDPGRGSPVLQALSRAIVANQAFEIRVLDEVGRNLAQPPLRLPFGLVLQPVATEGLTGARRFFKQPIPSRLGYAAGPMTETDVRFAKAMIAHHEGALEMARGYHADVAAGNGFLGLMNVDIITDQTQEIALMRWAIAAYPGDPDAVVVDPSMIHGMEGMSHGGSPKAEPGANDGGDHAGHGAAAAPAAPANPTAAVPHAGHAAPLATPVRARPEASGHGSHDGHASAARTAPRPGRAAPVPAASAGHQHHHH